jgi:hypothetical protein
MDPRHVRKTLRHMHGLIHGEGGGEPDEGVGEAFNVVSVKVGCGLVQGKDAAVETEGLG